MKAFRARIKSRWLWLGLGAFLLFVIYQNVKTDVPTAQAFAPAMPVNNPGSVARLIQRPYEGLKVYALYTGDIQVGGEAMLDPKNSRVRAEELHKQFVPAMAYLIYHPREGYLLFDTGFGPAFARSSNGDLGWWTKPLVKTRVHAGQDLISQMNRLGVSPSALKYVVLSHGHVDHTGGLPALGSVPVLIGKGERDAIAQPMSLLHGYKQAHFAKVAQLFEVDFTHAPDLDPLGRAVDLFGDGSIYLIDSHGHTPGHLSLLVNLRQGPLILAGDVVQSRRAFHDAIPSGNSTNITEAYTAARRLAATQEQIPGLRAFYGHDAEQAAHALQPPLFYQ
ncbi:N-acyl homoserine lactonase family protein [Acidobacteria bacterium AB60]|nr:N-acyl homoserine lactonase family protein [Acidobacteria bacterium AB60]